MQRKSSQKRRASLTILEGQNKRPVSQLLVGSWVTPRAQLHHRHCIRFIICLGTTTDCLGVEACGSSFLTFRLVWGIVPRLVCGESLSSPNIDLFGGNKYSFSSEGQKKRKRKHFELLSRQTRQSACQTTTAGLEGCDDSTITSNAGRMHETANVSTHKRAVRTRARQRQNTP